MESNDARLQRKTIYLYKFFSIKLMSKFFEI